MKLKGKILALSLIPVIALGTLMFLVAADRIANGIYDEAYIGMQATTLAVRDIFEQGNDGTYHMDESGTLWKGDTFNISQATDITDHIKENTGMEVTVFWHDTRILTSIMDDRGKRQIGTKAPAQAIDRVLERGDTYQDRDVEILGKKYIVCYTPIYQKDQDEIVGMIFLGTPQAEVSAIINKVRGQLLSIILLVSVLVTILAYIMVTRIVSALKMNMDTLDNIARGMLHTEIAPKILSRKDEIGDLGRNILHLKDELRSIVTQIHAKSKALGKEADHIEKISESVYQVMKEVNDSAQEMAASCSTQSEDADQASANVSSMGGMIENNTEQLTRLHGISDHMRNDAEEAITAFAQLNAVMENVKGSIHFLSQQTELTNGSVAKIGSATELITAIASQTNLLSLNANIEAARAGEHGRSFAVVASEIQQLSEQSDRAAGDIQSMISNLNTNSAQTLERVKEVQRIIDRQEQNIQKTSAIFQEVCNNVDQSASGMDTILENSKGLEDIRTDTIEIVQNSAALSSENSASIQEIMTSIETICHELGDITEKTRSLNILSQEMTASVDAFQLA